jgi:hypothetical protein
MCYFSRDFDYLPGCGLVFPISPQISPLPSALVGSAHQATIAISPGSWKVGMPEGSTTEDFRLDDLKQILMNRSRLSESEAEFIAKFFRNLENTQPTGKAEVDAMLYSHIKQNLGFAAVIPGLVTPIVEAFIVDAESLGLDQEDVFKLKRVCKYINNDSGWKQLFIPEKAIAKLYENAKDYVVARSDALREDLGGIVMACLASYSSARAFNAISSFDKTKINKFLKEFVDASDE